MRPLLLALVLFAAARADGAAILYATAASENRVDGFCIRGDGSLSSSPVAHVDTQGEQPRRLVVGPNGDVLYVCEKDRVEAFRIGARGGLTGIGGTGAIRSMDPRDVAFSPDGTLLYVPQNSHYRIVAYPLDAEGAPLRDGDQPPVFTSCIAGPTPTGYQRLLVRGSYLYVAVAAQGGFTGRVSVFPLAADGQLPEAPPACPGRREDFEPTCPLSERRRVPRPRAFVIDGDVLYVEAVDAHRILAFRLMDGLFAPPERKEEEGVPVSVCLKDAEGNDIEGPFRWQQRESRTAELRPYQDMVMVNGTLLGSQFARGRVDAFRLKDDGTLRSRPSRQTREDLRGSPVGLAARGNVLYVAAGELDRVQAFRLGRENGLPDATPFSETAEEKNSFPNALAVAEIEASCE